MNPRRSENEAADLVKGSAGLARAATRGFRRPGVEPDDLLQEAYLALYRAALLWDDGNGTPFAGYAWPIMRRSLSRFIRREQHALHLDHRATERLPRIHDARAALRPLLEREPTVDEVADYLGEDPTEVSTLLWATSREQEVSLDGCAGDTGSSSNPELERADTGSSVVGADLRAELVTAMGRAQLTPRQTECLTLLYLSGAQRSQSDVAAQMGISRQRVQALRAESIRKIQVTSVITDFNLPWTGNGSRATHQPEAQGDHGELK
ncbi:MAG: sigma-70 family RNA polymerase sigma factor [marine benthic group bacterium]|jgi:RNA polymerase sigma factor (sigma-70 family)|nr:sigma-70 family RNA polymerase sigma factor [Candidatus Carthagonibacter metallireducens]